MPDITNLERSDFQKHTGVSYETIHRLDRYAEMLNEWNQRMNLVSESTLPHIWTRHFLDSAQLLPFIPKNTETLADMGTGAGFPGLVLSIMDVPGITLIEATGKKVEFLKAVIEELKLPTTVRQDRVETIRDYKADVITARALKSLRELFQFASPLMKKESICIFLKGRSLVEELTESSKSWRFKHEKRTSLSDPSGNVLVVRDLQYKHAASRKFNR